MGPGAHPAGRWERYAKRQSRSGTDRGNGVPRQQERSAGMSRNGPGGREAVCATALVCGTLDDGQLNLPSGGHPELHARAQPDYLV
jgi:hypothetical protein